MPKPRSGRAGAVRIGLLITAMAGCSSSTDVDSRIPRTGVYVYEASIPQSSAFGAARTLNGTFRVTLATMNALAGVWSVPGIEPTSDGPSGWNADAYIIWAELEGFGDINNRVRTSANGMSCEGLIVGITGGGVISLPVACSFTYQGQ